MIIFSHGVKSAERRILAKIPEDMKFTKLRTFNLAMGFLHLVQGGLMLWLSNSFSVPVKETLLHYDSATQTIVSNTETPINLRLGS